MANPGRPRLYRERLSDYVTLKVTPEQRRAIEQRAEQAGFNSLGAYVRAVALDESPAQLSRRESTNVEKSTPPVGWSPTL
jgi:hypothetical protein